MKKLIATMAAIVTGFAAWATLPSYTTFEGSNEFSDGALVVDGTTWSTNGAPTLTQGTYAEGEAYGYQSGNMRYTEFSGDNSAYLDVKTTFGQPLERLVNETVAADTPVYFDQLVKFTATDEEPNLDLYTNEKLVIYALDKSELDTGATPATNLMVVAGRYVNGVLSSATYDFGAINIDAWHRLTIKAIRAYNDTALGFEIFLDGVALAYDSSIDRAYDSAAIAGLTPNVRALNSGRKIVASLMATASVAAVGFDGQGAIDDVMATTTKPGDWADDFYFTLNWTPETLTALSYTAHGAEVELDATALAAGTVQIPYDIGMTVTVTPTFASNRAFDSFTLDGCTANGYVLTVSSAAASATLVAKDVTPRIEYVVGETTNYYPTFAAALADVSSGTLKLKMPVSVGLNGEITEGTIESDKNITIDLAGQTITGTATDFEGYVFNVLGGSLTIMDSSGNDSGSVVMGAGTSYAGVVNVGSIDNDNIGTLAISGGTFEGAVVVDSGDDDPEEGYPAGEASLTGGKYKYLSNTTSDEFTLAGSVAEGYTAAKDDDETSTYWVINALPKATVALTYDSTKVTVTGVAAGDQVAVGSTITVTATPKTGYENAVVTINGTAQSTYTVVDADVSNGVTITVAVTPITWTITYHNDDAEETTFATDTYTIENRATKELNAGTKAGYTFNGWEDTEYNLVTSLAEMTGDIDLYGTWQKSGSTGHTVTITWSDAVITQVTYRVDGAAAVEATNGADITVADNATFTIAARTSSDWTKVSGLVTDLAISTDTNFVLSTAQFNPETDFTGKTAAEIAAATGIDTGSALVAAGEVTVKKAITWAEANGVSPARVNEMVFTAGSENQAAKAFLFGVADTDEAVAAAEAAFAFASITPGTVPSIPAEKTANYNGTVTVKGSATVDGTYVAPTTDAHRFYKAVLALPTAN